MGETIVFSTPLYTVSVSDCIYNTQLQCHGAAEANFQVTTLDCYQVTTPEEKFSWIILLPSLQPMARTQTCFLRRERRTDGKKIPYTQKFCPTSPHFTHKKKSLLYMLVQLDKTQKILQFSSRFYSDGFY